MSQLPSQPWISECYDELLTDVALVQSFPVKECMSTNDLHCLSVLHLCVVSEELLPRLMSLELWGQVRVNFTTNSGKRAMSEEIIPMAILITNGVGEGRLGTVTIFCHSDQAKVQPSVMLPTLFQDSHQLAIVVMKILTNLPYLPWGSFSLPFLDVATLPEDASSIQLPLS